MRYNRRQFCEVSLAAATSLTAAASLCAAENKPFRFSYIVASAMYGKAPLEAILAEVPKTGSRHIEIWREPHGNQREQINELSEEKFRQLLQTHSVQLGSVTCFKVGIFNMVPEMEFTQRLGGDMVICNSGGKKDLTGRELRQEVRLFAEKLQPSVERAESLGITIGLENHGGGLISSPESIRVLMDTIPSPAFGLAMAPYHLPQNPKVISKLITDLGERLVHFQAWEHGNGCTEKLPKEQELLQLPHRGPLDWKPIVAALQSINYQGRTQIFMHPVPRGIPILPEIAEVTNEIITGQKYLENLIVSQ